MYGQFRYLSRILDLGGPYAPGHSVLQVLVPLYLVLRTGHGPFSTVVNRVVIVHYRKKELVSN